MIYSQIFHQIVYFTSEIFIFSLKISTFLKIIYVNPTGPRTTVFTSPPQKKTLKGFNLQLLSRQLCSLSLSRKPGNGSELRIINQGGLLQDSG
jgi:hypothetical protein